MTRLQDYRATTLHPEWRTACTSKESVDIALAAAGRDGEVRHLGAVAGGVDAVSKACAAWSAGATVCM